jgi:hypothetical protein
MYSYLTLLFFTLCIVITFVHIILGSYYSHHPPQSMSEKCGKVCAVLGEHSLLQRLCDYVNNDRFHGFSTLDRIAII